MFSPPPSLPQSRLRRQDVGLKSHLQQLDLQISELKLDVNKVSPDQLESDSRPSSGRQTRTHGHTHERTHSRTHTHTHEGSTLLLPSVHYAI